MSSDEAWRLVVHQKVELPTLIVRSVVGADGYTILLSDLDHIWTERVDKPRLLERAQELGCSIDPAEDDKQYKIFTSKLRDALSQRDGTTLELKSARSGTNITVALTVSLPHPLKPLEWEVHLQKQDDGLKFELIQPLFQQVHNLQEQLNSLFTELRAKDHVISRFSEYVERSGVPLADIFPNLTSIAGVSRSRPPSREQLSQRVHGLTSFDEIKWVQNVSSQKRQNEGTTSDVIGNLSPDLTEIKDHKSNWWRGLDIRIDGPTNNATEDTLLKRTSSAQPNTPPLSTVRGKRTDTDGTTPQDVMQREPESRPKARLGTIGGWKKNAAEEEDEEEKKKSKKITEPEEVNTELSGSNVGMNEVVNGTPAQPELVSRPKARLGAVGVRRREAADHKSTTEVPGQDTNEIAATPSNDTVQSQSASQAKARLGAIGRKRAVETATDTHTPSSKPPKQTVEEPSTTQVAEAVQDTIERNREKLKRELEERAKAPVKKKRKF